jgi:hypothetical protein
MILACGHFGQWVIERRSSALKRRLNSHRSRRKISRNQEEYSPRRQTDDYEKKTRKYGAIEVELEDELNEYEEELNKDN